MICREISPTLWAAGLVGFLVTSVYPSTSLAAAPLPASRLINLTFDQKLGAQLDLKLPFKDEAGHSVKLGDYFGKRPVILDLGYYQCPMLCTLVLNGLIQSLGEMQPSPDGQFEFVCVSISPTEGPALASAKKASYLRLYAHPGAASHWHFLTGNQPAIKSLADSVGFHYAFDPSVKQYAHPSGLVVVTSTGKVAKYFFGVRFPSGKLQAALSQAAAKQVGSPVQQLLILCCSFLPLIGKYSATIMLLVRIAGVLVLVVLALFVIRSFCREPRLEGFPESTQPRSKKV